MVAGSKGEDGLWDFGPSTGRSAYFPLSDNWRRKENRQIDYSTIVLALLRRYFVWTRPVQTLDPGTI